SGLPGLASGALTQPLDETGKPFAQLTQSREKHTESAREAPEPWSRFTVNVERNRKPVAPSPNRRQPVRLDGEVSTLRCWLTGPGRRAQAPSLSALPSPRAAGRLTGMKLLLVFLAAGTLVHADIGPWSGAVTPTSAVVKIKGKIDQLSLEAGEFYESQT